MIGEFQIIGFEIDNKIVVSNCRCAKKAEESNALSRDFFSHYLTKGFDCGSSIVGLSSREIH